MNWREQHPAVRATLNPALVAATIGWAARGHESESGTGLAWPLAYVVPSIVLHKPTRDVLPSRVNKRLLLWRQEHEVLLSEFPRRCLALSPYVEAGMRTGLRLSLIRLDGPRIYSRIPTVNREHPLLDVFRAANFVGRWLSHVTTTTAMAQLGVRP